jgi:hypothetical protein
MELNLLIVFIFSLLIFCLQFINRHLLRQLLPPKFNKWATIGLIMIHGPLVFHVIIRLIGVGNNISWLLILAQISILFQLFTVMVLLACGILNIVWQWIKKWQPNNKGTFTSIRHKIFLKRTSIIGICLAIFCTIHGVRKAKSEPYITRFELKFTNLPPGLDGLRIVQISDLHAGPMVPAKQMEWWRYLAEKEKPEILLITGDMVDSLPEEAKIVADAFQNFRAPLGCFAILGNHDYFIDPKPIWSTLASAGIKFLENSNILISRNGAKLAIIGLQDAMANHKHPFSGQTYGDGPQPTIAEQGIPKNAWRICICHRPSDWQLAKLTGAMMTLSGHTHGGQVNFIPGISSALLLGKKYTQGLYKEGQQYLYVNRGLGVVALPIRIGAHPEIAVITLRKE